MTGLHSKGQDGFVLEVTAGGGKVRKGCYEPNLSPNEPKTLIYVDGLFSCLALFALFCVVE